MTLANRVMAPVQVPTVRHRVVEVGGVRVFYRESGPVDATPLLLLHGFPSGSHQFRRLIDALGTRHHLIAPDYPGFGYTEAPADFAYSFDALADVVDGFLAKLGIQRFALYMFDFGAPVGFRVAMRHPDRIAGLVVQNGNAYEVGLSDAAREMIANRPGVDGAAERVQGLLDVAVTRSQYETGASDLSLVGPDGWTLDQLFLDRPGRAAAQVALALDYHSNVALYPVWQRWLRDRQPPALVLWGRGDPFFVEAGARAYLDDLPEAELHLFDTGHFALEECLPAIAPLVSGFLGRALGAPGPVPPGTTPSSSP
jgi:pimeloyl-ACP methyl ester carboxylesterase